MKETDTTHKMQSFFEIARGPDGWHWMFFSPNGRRIATNVVPLASKKDCRRIIGAMIVQMAACKVICEKEGTPDEEAEPIAEPTPAAAAPQPEPTPEPLPAEPPPTPTLIGEDPDIL